MSLGTVSNAFSTNLRAILPCTSSIFSTTCVIPLLSWTLAVLPRCHLLLFSWPLRLKPSPTVWVLGWVAWCPCTFLVHAHPFFSSISALSGPSSTPSVPFPPAYTRSAAFLSTWLPPLQPSSTSSRTSRALVALHFYHLVHCCFHFFLSYLRHFHLSPNRARELEATCCSYCVQQLLQVSRQYRQHLTFCDEPRPVAYVVIYF